MRAAVALFCVSAASVLGATCACAAPAGEPLVGASDAWSNAPEPAAIRGPSPAALWDTYGEAQSWPAANGAPFNARGHQPEQLVDVRVNELARTVYLALVTDSVFQDGSVLAELPHSAVGTGNGFAMRKEAGQWLFFELDPRGQLLAGGALALCAGCHAEAPADHVFGVPRAP